MPDRGGGRRQADLHEVRRRADLEGVQLELVLVEQRPVPPEPELFEERRHLGFGRIVVSDIKAPNMLANML